MSEQEVLQLIRFSPALTATREPPDSSGEVRLRFACEIELPQTMHCDSCRVQTVLRGAEGLVLFCDDSSLDLQYRSEGAFPVSWSLSVKRQLVERTERVELRPWARVVTVDASAVCPMEQVGQSGCCDESRSLGKVLQVGPATVRLYRQPPDPHDIRIEAVGQLRFEAGPLYDRATFTLTLLDGEGAPIASDDRSVDINSGLRSPLAFSVSPYWKRRLVEQAGAVEVRVQYQANATAPPRVIEAAQLLLLEEEPCSCD